MRSCVLIAALALAHPGYGQAGDDAARVPPAVLAGKAYQGSGLAAEIEFINTRREPVRLYWIRFDGSLQLYATIGSGAELIQPTFVSHRWMVAGQGGDTPIAAFIATRADAHADGQPQIAVIR